MRIAGAMVLAALVLAGGGAAGAMEAPRAGGADPRMRWIDYDPAQVYRVQGAFRTATQILFGSDETIQHVALGDSVSWEVAAEKNILFLKPKEAQAATNLIVTTAAGGRLRNYMFELVTMAEGRRGGAYYQVRFRYPQDERDRAAAALSAAEAAVRRRMTALKLERGAVEGPRNYRYTVQGARELQPSEVSDNGRFTLLRFPASQPVPAIYSVTADGSESLVPFDVRGEFVVVHSVEQGLRLRRGRSVLCIYNEAYPPHGVNPGSGTASAVVDRTLRGGPP